MKEHLRNALDKCWPGWDQHHASPDLFLERFAASIRSTMTKERELLTEVRWHLMRERGNDWRTEPTPHSPRGSSYIGDFGDAGQLFVELAEALATVLGLSETMNSSGK